jgi:glutaminase|tara:strand:+ start:436 stop:837 length:402 start_codon:yes stop_codon:yes gene_type:complete
MSDNVIKFPKAISNEINSEEDLAATHNIVEDMQQQKVASMSNYLAESILMAGAKEMSAQGVDVTCDEFLKDYAFALEALRSCLYRHGKVHHDMQDLVDRYCKFTLKKNRAGEIAQVGVDLMLDELEADENIED